jgi:sugar-specific transcriptional regulator TrmB
MLKNLFEEIGLSETSHRVYLQLLENGASSARTLAENLSIPRPSVYDNLEILIQKGLVTERYEENKKLFQVDDVKNLPRLLDNKINSLTKEKKDVESLMPELLKQSISIEPKIKFYSGAEGVKQVLNDMLWHKNIKTVAMWPISEMIELLGKDYMTEMNQRRIRQNISIRGLWPENKAVKLKDYPFLGIGKGHLRDLRMAPKEVAWNMSYWLYEDKVAFISSRKETFGFVVHSRDFAELIKTQFEVIWKVSKPIKPEPQYSDAFLKTV